MAWQEVLYGSLEHCWALFWVTQASGRFFFAAAASRARESWAEPRAARARGARSSRHSASRVKSDL